MHIKKNVLKLQYSDKLMLNEKHNIFLKMERVGDIDTFAIHKYNKKTHLHERIFAINSAVRMLVSYDKDGDTNVRLFISHPSMLIGHYDHSLILIFHMGKIECNEREVSEKEFGVFEASLCTCTEVVYDNEPTNRIINMVDIPNL